MVYEIHRGGKYLSVAKVEVGSAVIAERKVSGETERSLVRSEGLKALDGLHDCLGKEVVG